MDYVLQLKITADSNQAQRELDALLGAANRMPAIRPAMAPAVAPAGSGGGSASIVPALRSLPPVIFKPQTDAMINAAAALRADFQAWSKARSAALLPVIRPVMEPAIIKAPATDLIKPQTDAMTTASAVLRADLHNWVRSRYDAMANATAIVKSDLDNWRRSRTEAIASRTFAAPVTHAPIMPLASFADSARSALNGLFNSGSAFKGMFGAASALSWKSAPAFSGGGGWGITESFNSALSAAGRIGPAIAALSGPVGMITGALTSGFSSAFGIIGNIGGTLLGLPFKLLSLKTALVGAMGPLAVYASHKMLGPAAEEESYQTQLSRMGKSDLLPFYQQLTRKSPYSLGQITEGGIMAENMGISSKQFYKTIIDAAAAFNRPVQEVVRAAGYIKSERYGEGMEALARFGVTRQQFQARGIQYNKSGEVLEASKPQVFAAMIDIMQAKFGGAAAGASRTYEGSVSQLGNAVWQGMADTFKGLLPDATKVVQELTKGVESVAGVFKNFDWSTIGKKISETVKEARLVMEDLFTPEGRAKFTGALGESWNNFIEKAVPDLAGAIKTDIGNAFQWAIQNAPNIIVRVTTKTASGIMDTLETWGATKIFGQLIDQVTGKSKSQPSLLPNLGVDDWMEATRTRAYGGNPDKERVILKGGRFQGFEPKTPAPPNDATYAVAPFPGMPNAAAALSSGARTTAAPVIDYVTGVAKENERKSAQSGIDSWAKGFTVTKQESKDINTLAKLNGGDLTAAIQTVKGKNFYREAERLGITLDMVDKPGTFNIELAKALSGGNIPKSVTDAENRLAKVNDPSWKPSPEAYTEAWLSDKDRRNMVSMMQNSGMGFDDALRAIKGKDNADLFLGSPDLKSFQGSMQNRKPDTDSGEAELRRKTTELKDRMDEQSKTISKVNVQLNDLLDKFTAFSGAASVAARAMRDFNAQFAP